MKDMRKTKAQLVEELQQQRAIVARLEFGAGEGLGPSRQLMGFLIDQMLEPTVMLDFEGNLLHGNELAAGVLGLSSAAEIPGLGLASVMHPDSLQQAAIDLEGVKQATAPFSANYMLLIGGKTVHIESHGHRIDLADGPVDLVSFRDVTGLREKEERDRENELILRSVLDHSSTVIFIKDVEGKYLLINKRYEELFGVTNEEIVGKSDFDIFPADAAEQFQAKDKKAIEAGGPIEEEELVPHEDGPHTYISVKFPMYDADGEPFATCGISTDITERKQAEEALERHHEELEQRVVERTRELESEIDERRSAEEQVAIFHRLAEASGSGLGMADLDGTTTYLNPEACRMLGLERPEDGYGRPIRDFHPEETWQLLESEALPQVMDSGEWDGETALISKSGKVTPVIQSLFVLRDERGRPIKLASVLTDITERKQVEDSLKAEQERLMTLFDGINEVIYVSDPETYEILFANKYLREAFGKELVGGICYKEFQGFDEPCPFCTNERILKDRGEAYQWEHHNDVVNRDYLVTDRVIKWPDGRDVRFEVAIDITERKQTGKALEKSERMFRALTDSMQAMVMITDPQKQRIVYANAAAARGTGYSLEELTAKTPPNFLSEESLEEAKEYRDAFTRGEDVPTVVETKIVTKGGEERVLQSTWAVIDLPDEGLLKVTTSFDITERKRAEEALKESERKFRAVADITSAIIMMAGEDGRIFYANRAAEEATGYSQEELSKLDPMGDLFSMPGKEEWFLEEVERARRTGEALSGWEMKITRKDGEERWLEASGQFVELGGQLVDVSTSFDITERKLAEEEVARSERRLKEAQAIARVGNWEMDLVDGTLSWSDEIYQIYGIDPAAGPPDFDVALERLPQDDREKLLNAYEALLERDAEYSVVHRIIDPGGAIRWAQERGHVIRDENGKALSALGTTHDITEYKLAEEALKESEKKFRALAESTTAQITIIQDDKYTYANQAFLDYHGLDEEDLKVVTPEDLSMGMMSEESIQDALQAFQGAVESGDRHFRVEFSDTDGNWFQTDVTIIELDGKESFIGLTFDITDVKRAQAAIEDSEKKFRVLAESTTARIAITRGERFVYANKAMLEHSGVTWEELSRLHPHDWLTAEAHDAGRAAIEEAMAKGESTARFEFSEPDREGNERWFEVNASQLEIDGEKAMIWTSFDVTELKQAQQELAESEKRYRTIFDTAGTGMISFGADSVITIANEEWANLSGYSIDETVGKQTWVPFFTEQSLAKMKKYHEMRTVDPDSVPKAYEAQFVDRSGAIHDGIINIQVVPGTQQRVASFQDMTALKRAQKEMYRADKMAALGQIIAGVAHEINNPNNFIYFNLPILRKYLEAITPMLEQRLEDDPDLKILNMPYEVFLEDVFKLLENMEHGSSRITSIVADLKNYVRSDEDQELKREQVDRAIERVMTLVGKQVRKMVKRFDVDVADDLPAVEMNLGKIEQVLINLVINAGQAADKDDSWVKLSARLSEQHEGFVELLVADNGAGIPEENLEQIFEPFFTSKGREQGTGLGLSISHRIVEEHGGAIDVESTVGEGTVFTIRLPIA